MYTYEDWLLDQLPYEEFYGDDNDDKPSSFKNVFYPSLHIELFKLGLMKSEVSDKILNTQKTCFEFLVKYHYSNVIDSVEEAIKSSPDKIDYLNTKKKHLIEDLKKRYINDTVEERTKARTFDEYGLIGSRCRKILECKKSNSILHDEVLNDWGQWDVLGGEDMSNKHLDNVVQYKVFVRIKELLDGYSKDFVERPISPDENEEGLKPHKDTIYNWFKDFRDEGMKVENAFEKLLEKIKDNKLQASDYFQTDNSYAFNRSYTDWLGRKHKKRGQ